MDSYTVTTRQGYFSKLKSSLIGVLFGIVMFILSFVLLWWNEGNVARERAALKELQAAAVEGTASPSAARLESRCMLSQI